MKNTALFLSLVSVFCAASYAAALDVLPKDEQKLVKIVTDLDKDAALPEGAAAVESRLRGEFKVDDARVQGLRGRRLGYGEISIVLGLAEQMPGGITDANVAAIVALRQGPPVMGWGQIAKKQGVKLGKVISKVKNVGAAARKQGKADVKKLEQKAKDVEKSVRHESSERPERNVRPEKAAKPEHSRH